MLTHIVVLLILRNSSNFTTQVVKCNSNPQSRRGQQDSTDKVPRQGDLKGSASEDPGWVWEIPGDLVSRLSVNRVNAGVVTDVVWLTRAGFHIKPVSVSIK